MTENNISDSIKRQARQALWLWGVFIVLMVIVNGTIPFAFGIDLHGWTYSTAKNIIVHLLVYSGLFVITPLIMVKGWAMVRQPSFLMPLLVAVSAITLRPFERLSAILAVMVLAYLHWRFDLSDFGIRSQGCKGDALAIIFLGLLSAVPALSRSMPHSVTLDKALRTGLERLFVNPASTVENLFYFGFLAERLSYKLGSRLTAPLIGIMYTVHEMSNPEYWYEGMPFILTFVGVTITAMIYLWRRSVVVIWLGDGLSKLVSDLF